MGLLAALGEAQHLGYIGGGDFNVHLKHSLGFAAGVQARPEAAVDLGSGGGIPGLVLAMAWPQTRWWLVEGSTTRANFLGGVVERLRLGPRVQVVGQRAERAGRGPLRGSADVVVARGFGSPAVTAECAAPLLRVGGRLVVSEPPAPRPGRWPEAGLETLGMSLGPRVSGEYTYQVVVQARPCPQRFPRRVGVPTKRPAF